MLTKGLHEICQETIDSPPSCCTELRREEVGGGEETGKGKGDESEPTLREDREVELLCPGEKESHTTDNSGGLKQWDQGQRVSKSPPRTESRGYPSSFQSSQSDCSLCIWTFGSGKRSLRRDQGEVMILGRMWPAVLIFTDTPCRLGALSVCKVMPLACVSQAENPS